MCARINGYALLWFRPGSQKEASVQGCLRTHNTTEHFNHHTAGALVRRGEERDIQHPAAESRGGKHGDLLPV